MRRTDYSYDDPCEPTTLQGYVENVGGCPLQPVYITLSYRIKTGEKEWDAAALPIPRRLTLRGGDGNAVLLSKQQYTDEDQRRCGIFLSKSIPIFRKRPPSACRKKTPTSLLW